jgi:hypothetical protein
MAVQRDVRSRPRRGLDDGCGEERRFIYKRTSAPQGPAGEHPQEKWVRVDGAFKAVIKASVFHRANEVLAGMSSPLSDDAALDKLRALLAPHGRLSTELITTDPVMPCVDLYRARFAPLLKAYSRIGYRPARSFQWVEGHHWRWHFLEDLRQRVPEMLAATGVEVRRESRKITMIHDKYRVATMMARFRCL